MKMLPIPAALRRGIAGAASLIPGLVFANPTGGQVVAGQVNITNPAPNGTVVTEGSASAIVNWQTFNVGSNEYVQFIQPSSSSVILNRVIGNSPSAIFGSIAANGHVFLINPEGVLFAPGSTVDVGALVASTMDISNQEFLAGNYVFSGGVSGSGITNSGTITAASGGFVVLAGDYVHNTGVIQAQLGLVVLASGSALTLSMDPGGLISYNVDAAALSAQAGVANSGQILADGGRVIMTAEVAHNLVSTAINNTGLIRAEGISDHDGDIELTAAGGNITDSGTLDASSASGSGGTIQVRGDQDIDIQSGAQILAYGADQGGQIHIVADGTLNTRTGSLIDAHAVNSGGKGGLAELSGHGTTVVRGDVDLGHDGTLVIDPTNLTIASGTGTSSSATVFEQFIENQLRAGTNVNLVATRSITMDTLSDHVLDGTNGGNGGSLLLGIGTGSTNAATGVFTFDEGTGGTISFQTPTDSIKVDQVLNIQAGTQTGTINVGNLSAGIIQLDGLTSVTTGNLTATGNAISTQGNITISGGRVTVGTIDVTSPLLNEASLFIDATGNLTVTGSITLAGGGGAGSIHHGSSLAYAGLFSDNNVTVDGAITVTAQAFTRTGISDTAGSYSDTAGKGLLDIRGKNVQLASVQVSGVGGASFSAYASKDLTINGAVNVSTTRAVKSSTHSYGGTLEKFGTAQISLSADSGSVVTNGLVASGPSADVQVTGGTLTLRAGAGGNAISATAFTGGASPGGSGDYYLKTGSGGSTIVDTDFGLAAVGLGGFESIKSAGISVSGPAAALLIDSPGTINETGSLSVTGLGYTVNGNASQIGLSDPIPVQLEGFVLPPIQLNSGTEHWGAGLLDIAGNSYGGAAGNVTIAGGVTVQGLGNANADVNASSLSVTGSVVVQAGKGTIQGIALSSALGANSSLAGSISRTISGNSNGAATYGLAETTIVIGNHTGDVSLGSLKVSGYSARATINGGDNITIKGSTTVDGLFGGAAPDFQEITVFTPLGDSRLPGFTATTDWLGDNNGLEIGNTTAPAGTVKLGDVSVSGYGFAQIVVHGNTISMGDVSLTQSSGMFVSNDPTRASASYSVLNPGAALNITATSGPATASSISVAAAGPVAQALNLTVANGYTVTAPSYSSTVPGAVLLLNPIAQGAPSYVSGPKVPVLPPNQTLQGVDVGARDITLSLGNLAMSDEQLTASQALSIQTVGSFSDSNSVLSAPTVTITAGTSLSLTGTTVDAALSLALNAGGAVTVSAESMLYSPAITVSAGSGLNLSSTEIAGSSHAAATSVSLTGGSVVLGSGVDVSALDIVVGATAGDIDLTNDTLSALHSLTLNASGAIADTGAVPSKLHGSTITATAGSSLTLNGTTLAGSSDGAPSATVTLSGGSATFGAGVHISAANLTLTTTTGDLSLTSDNLNATQALAINAAGALSVTNSVLGGGAVALTAGTDLTIADSSLFGASPEAAATSLSLSATGGNLVLSGSTALDGDAVVLNAGDSITASFGGTLTPVITAGALSAQALQSIDLTLALLQIGTGAAQFGSDPNLLGDIQGSPLGGSIPLPDSGPNAAFSAQTVALGTVQALTPGDSLYLYIESQAVASGLGYSIGQITGASTALLNYVPFSGGSTTSPPPPSPQTPGVPPLTIDGSVSAPPGLTTLVIGNTSQTENIVVDQDAAFQPGPASVNLVFATQGTVTGADNLKTSGAVLVLQLAAVASVAPPSVIPLPQDYTPPPPDSLSSPPQTQGDPDDSGVNNANKGQIDQQSSAQSTLLTCGGGT